MPDNKKYTEMLIKANQRGNKTIKLHENELAHSKKNRTYMRHLRHPSLKAGNRALPFLPNHHLQHLFNVSALVFPLEENVPFFELLFCHTSMPPSDFGQPGIGNDEGIQGDN